jgi:DNA uptake protein ComE-like DNA-binding protein
MKKPAGVDRRRAWVFLLDLSGRLLQAMAVRRHLGPVMMVMTVMAVALHLTYNIKESMLPCQILCLQPVTDLTENGAVRTKIRLTIRCAALALAILSASLYGMTQNQDRDSNGAPETSRSAPPPEMRIDINHASIDELMKAPGMTRSWAGRIVRFRPYRTKDELLEKGVVNSQVYDRIKNYVISHRDPQ